MNSSSFNGNAALILELSVAWSEASQLGSRRLLEVIEETEGRCTPTSSILE